MKKKRFECCQCNVDGMTLKQAEKHNLSAKHYIRLALERLGMINSNISSENTKTVLMAMDFLHNAYNASKLVR